MISVSVRVSGWSKVVATIVLIEVKASLGKAVETTPEQLVRDDDKERHDNDAANDEWGVPLLSDFRNKSAQTFSLERRLAPHGNFGDDAGVPSSTGSGASAGHPKRTDGGKN